MPDISLNSSTGSSPSDSGSVWGNGLLSSATGLSNSIFGGITALEQTKTERRRARVTAESVGQRGETSLFSGMALSWIIAAVGILAAVWFLKRR